MTDSTVENTAERETEPKVGPGPRLREAREARKLSIEAAAVQLRIDPALLRALENDDYSKFAAPIFITGNLRAYARLLDLPPDPLLDAYHGLGRDEPPALKQVQRYPRLGSTPSLAPAVIVLLVAVVAVLLYLGWRDGARMPSFSPAEDAQLSLPEALLDSAPQASDGTAMPFEDSFTGAVEPAPPAATASAPPEPAVEAPRSPPPVRATLSLKADQASWVEVRDASGRRLLYDLLDPGAMRNLQGVPPFEVLLGYAPGVTVEFNSKLVDHGPYTRKETARFKVDEDGAGRL